MSKFQGLKDFISLRLNAAVEEIFGHIERTIAEYEEEMDRRHDTGLTAQVELKGPDVQQLVVVFEEVPPEQQDCSSSLAQKDPELPHIKEEQGDFWTSQEGEQLPGLEEADNTKLLLTPVLVKNEEEEEEEKPQSSQLHQRHTEHMETESAEEDCGEPGSGPESGSDDKTEDSSESYTDDSDDDDDWKWTRKSQSVQKNKDPVSEDRVTDQNLSCTECGKRFGNKTNLRVHMLIHTKEKPFCCTTCGKIFSEKKLLIRHMKDHKEKKSFSCSLCFRRFRYRGTVDIHMKRHLKGKLPASESLD